MNVPVLSTNIFHSARLKLTAFYFAFLVVFCLLLTFGARVFTEHELAQGESAQRGAVHQLFQRYTDIENAFQPGMPGDRYYLRSQEEQANIIRQNLTRDFVLIDIALLSLGALLSYWYAGRTLQPIEEAHEQQRRFTSDASHELRTPLASMKLENEIFLRQKTFTEAEAREIVASNLEEVDRLEKLATNLLALNRYEHGDMSHAPIAVSELVGAAVAQVRQGRAAKKLKFQLDLTPAQVDVNRDSMVELIAILLDNAAKYGPHDGTVEITGDMINEEYVLNIRDHGPGIIDKDLPHIFERMYRGDKARSNKVAGHGIGLSLARQIAEANEASLEAQNALEGSGAIFVLTIR